MFKTCHASTQEELILLGVRVYFRVRVRVAFESLGVFITFPLIKILPLSFFITRDVITHWYASRKRVYPLFNTRVSLIHTAPPLLGGVCQATKEFCSTTTKQQDIFGKTDFVYVFQIGETFYNTELKIFLVKHLKNQISKRQNKLTTPFTSESRQNK